MRRAISWWLSAPFDEKTAVAIVVIPWLIFAAVLIAAPSPPSP